MFAFRARRVGFVAEALRVSGKHVAVYKHGLEDDFGLNAADPENLDVEESQLNKLPDAVARDFAMATPKTGPNAERVSFALFVLTSRIAANVRTVVDARVVVLGGDDAALAAVEFLATHACVLHAQSPSCPHPRSFGSTLGLMVISEGFSCQCWGPTTASRLTAQTCSS